MILPTAILPLTHSMTWGAYARLVSSAGEDIVAVYNAEMLCIQHETT